MAPTLCWHEIDAILQQMQYAELKHGPLTRDPVRACAILGREWGEAMNEALLLTKALTEIQLNLDRCSIHRHDLYLELAQVAATAATIMEALREHPSFDSAGRAVGVGGKGLNSITSVSIA